MDVKGGIKKFWKFLQEDSWQSWLVSIVLIIIIVKGIVFPTLSWVTGTSLPLVVIESCSMYHDNNFDDWWELHGDWYSSRGITREQFDSYPFRNGLNKGDIIVVWGKSAYNPGDIIIFNANAQYPIIHRIVQNEPLATKGDNNPRQLSNYDFQGAVDETNISSQQVLGKAVGRIPYAGWVKLIFFEPFRSPDRRGLCQESQQNI